MDSPLLFPVNIGENKLKLKHIFIQFVIMSLSRMLMGSLGKNLPANAGDMSLIPELGRSPGEGSGNPLQYSCLGNPMDKRSLLGYSSWCCKESDTI